MNKKSKAEVHKKSQIRLLLSQLAALRHELRETLRAYEAHLEILLTEVMNQFVALKTAKRVPRDRLDPIDKIVVLLRNRQLKPEKGRRKDLRKIEKLIHNLHAVAQPKIQGR